VEEILRILTQDYDSPDPLVKTPASYESSFPENDMPFPTEVILTWCLEQFIFSRICQSRADPKTIPVMGLLMHRFEIDKSLGHNFGEVSVKSKNSRKMSTNGNELFSVCLLAAYLYNQDIRFLNALLKIDSAIPEIRLNAVEIIEGL
jgi:hypothetical protein